MRPYLAILKIRFAALFQYRAAALAGLFTQVFWGMIKSMILTAFYANSSIEPSITLSEALTFVWLSQGFLLLAPWNIDKEIESQIVNGNISYELARPIDIYWCWYCRALSMRLLPTLLRSIPLFIIAFVFFDLSLPHSAIILPFFICSLIFAALLSAAITVLVLTTLFWTISGEGIVRILPGVTLFFTGLVVPIPLFPNWLQPFMNIQPLRGIFDIPIRLYTGIISINEAPLYLAFQLGWTIIIVFCGKILIKKAMRHVVIQGG